MISIVPNNHFVPMPREAAPSTFKNPTVLFFVVESEYAEHHTLPGICQITILYLSPDI